MADQFNHLSAVLASKEKTFNHNGSELEQDPVVQAARGVAYLKLTVLEEILIRSSEGELSEDRQGCCGFLRRIRGIMWDGI